MEVATPFAFGGRSKEITPGSCCFYSSWWDFGCLLPPGGFLAGAHGAYELYIYFISCMFEFRIKMRLLEHKMLAVFIEIDIINAGIMRAAKDNGVWSCFCSSDCV